MIAPPIGEEADSLDVRAVPPRPRRHRAHRIVLGALIVLLVLGLGVTGFAGNYLVTYALAVGEDGTVASSGDEIYDGRQNTDAQRVYDQWVQTAASDTWQITSDDGLTLSAVFYPADGSHDYVLSVHGYSVDHLDIAPAVVPFVQHGFNALMIDQRGRGASEGDHQSMGVRERFDVVRWAERIVEHDPQARIVLYGESMGGATVLQAAGEQLPDTVYAVVEDCGYTSAYAMFRDQLKVQFGLPEFPFLPAADAISQVRYGFGFSQADAVAALDRATLPILFIHGGEDDYVPTYMGRELYDAYRGEKQLLIVPGAGHGESADVDPEAYYETVFAFLDEHRGR